MRFLQADGKKVLFFSNTSDRLPLGVCKKLIEEGFPAEEDQVVTSGMALSLVLAERGLVGKPIISVGNRDTDEYVRQAGGKLTLDVEEAEASVLGFYPTPQNETAFDLAIDLAKRRNKPAFLANPDCLIPISQHEIGIGPGVIGEIFANRSGQAPIEIGKPAPYMYRLALEKLDGIPNESILAIGDSLDYDILGANRQRIDSLLVLSGLQGMVTPELKLDEFMRMRGIYPTYIHQALAYPLDLSPSLPT